tara:strand:- start:2549 stop:2998 length:450 start_codon:yes stop_codon:yes gene_type:complete
MFELLKNNIISCVLVILICLCLFLLLNKVYVTDSVEDSVEDYVDNKNSKFIFLYMDGCKFCEDLKKNIWKTNNDNGEFQKAVRTNPNLKHKVKLYSYNTTDRESIKRKKYVNESGGYPTLVLEKSNGKYKIYDGPRDTPHLINWLIKHS